ncbi:hypothetical protein PLEI_2139 [Photobacterium leiognathi lrivu.4.1]|uniref:Uncharacterized protein n=1 Tax=Photobacterium leiognathi lrivu.4.1 TaxID=1248232 RepID=A0A0U1P7I8_PHOLE|nr:hypothetical protein [Photobacterium leiognathi]GAD30483.1 hypothetical protein PLEI_2139 [Photobacterium leiognathi lrivu.4.1]
MKIVKCLCLMFFMLLFSSTVFSEAHGNNAMGGGAPAINLYSCEVKDSAGHQKSLYVPRYYCEQIGGKVIF